MRDQIGEQVTAIISELCGLSHIRSTDTFGDLGGDSLVMAEVIMVIEDELKVKVPLSGLGEATKVSDVIYQVKEKLRLRTQRKECAQPDPADFPF